MILISKKLVVTIDFDILGLDILPLDGFCLVPEKKKNAGKFVEFLDVELLPFLLLTVAFTFYATVFFFFLIIIFGVIYSLINVHYV
jgi:hypothetical protein